MILSIPVVSSVHSNLLVLWLLLDLERGLDEVTIKSICRQMVEVRIFPS